MSLYLRAESKNSRLDQLRGPPSIEVITCTDAKQNINIVKHVNKICAPSEKIIVHTLVQCGRVTAEAPQTIQGTQLA